MSGKDQGWRAGIARIAEAMFSDCEDIPPDEVESSLYVAGQVSILRAVIAQVAPPLKPDWLLDSDEFFTYLLKQSIIIENKARGRGSEALVFLAMQFVEAGVAGEIEGSSTSCESTSLKDDLEGLAADNEELNATLRDMEDEITRLREIAVRPRGKQIVATYQSLLSDAEICRRNGWTFGTLLAGNEGYGWTIVEITAVGLDDILAITRFNKNKVIEDAQEHSWTLKAREWYQVRLSKKDDLMALLRSTAARREVHLHMIREHLVPTERRGLPLSDADPAA